MANLAEFGVVIKAPDGLEKTVAGFRQIDEASKKATHSVQEHQTALDRTASGQGKTATMSAMVATQLLAAGVNYNAATKTFHTASANMASGLNNTATASAKATGAFHGAAGGIFAMGEAARKTPTGIVAMGNAMDKARADAAKSAAAMASFKSGLTALASAIGTLGLIAGLAALATGIYAVAKAWDFLKDSLSAAGQVQNASVSLELLIGHAGKAKRVMDELNELNLKTGMFDEQSLLRAATQLFAIGVNADELAGKVKELGNVAAVLDQPIESSVSSYIRMVGMLGNTGKLQARTLIQFQQQGFDVLRVLSDATGKSQEEVHKMVETGKVGLKEIDAALRKFAENDFMGARSRTWVGLGRQVSAAWEEVHEVFGRPIIDALSPIVTRLLSGSGMLIKLAEQWGDEVGHVIRALDTIGREHGWLTMLQLAWQIAINKMAGYAVDVLVKAFVALGPALAKAMWEGFKGWGGAITLNPGAFAKTLGDEILKALTDSTPEMQTQLDKMMQDALDRTKIGSMEKGAAGGAAFTEGEKRNAIYTPTLDVPQSDFDKYKSDLNIIIEHWKEYTLIQQTAASETERTRRVMELESRTARELADPEAYAKQFTTIQGKWEAMEEARLRKTLEVDAKIRMGNASVFEAMESGIDKVIKAWGNMAQKVEKATMDIAGALSTGISSGLTDIITGTVDLKTGFQNMAVSILKDIAAILIKMQVEIVMQTILNSLRGVGGGGITGSATAAAGYVPIGATGGAIHGPSHAGGGVPIEAEGGEFMLRKSAVRNQRMEDLYALNAGQAMIVPRKKYPDGGPIEPPNLHGAGATGGYLGYPHYFYGTPISAPWHNPFAGSHAGGSMGPRGLSPTTSYWYYNSLVNGPFGNNPFAPGGGHHSAFSPYNPFGGANAGGNIGAGNPFGGAQAGGNVGAGNPFAPGGRYHSSFTQRPDIIAAMQRLGYGTLFYDSTRDVYVSASGQVIAGFDPSTGGYIMRNGEAVGGAMPPGAGEGDGGSGGVRGSASVRAGANVGANSYIGAVIRAFPSLNNPASIRALAMGARPTALLGRNQFDSHAANLSLMSQMSQHDPVNFAGARRATSDEGITTNHPFASNMMLIRDSEGGFTQRSFHRDRSHNAGLIAWAAGHSNVGQLYGPRMHTGGIVGEGGAYHMAQGGDVPITAARGEGIFTPGQMAAIGRGMGGGGGSHVEVNVTIVDNSSTVSSTKSGPGGMSESDAKRMGEMMVRVANQEIARNKRHDGQLYMSRNGASR